MIDNVHVHIHGDSRMAAAFERIAAGVERLAAIEELKVAKQLNIDAGKLRSASQDLADAVSSTPVPTE